MQSLHEPKSSAGGREKKVSSKKKEEERFLDVPPKRGFMTARKKGRVRRGEKKEAGGRAKRGQTTSPHEGRARIRSSSREGKIGGGRKRRKLSERNRSHSETEP